MSALLPPFSFLSGAVAHLVNAGHKIAFPVLSPGRIYWGQEAVRVADLCHEVRGEYQIKDGKIVDLGAGKALVEYTL
jgi:hypothetical protein